MSLAPKMNETTVQSGANENAIWYKTQWNQTTTSALKWIKFYNYLYLNILQNILKTRVFWMAIKVFLNTQNLQRLL